MHEDRKQRLAEFVAWVREHLTGDEKGEAQIFLDRLFQAFELKGVREAGATLEMRVKKRDEGGTAFADLVYKPIVLIEMKKRGTDLKRHYRQAFDYWVELAPNRPKYVVLCNFDEFWVYDFDSAQYDEPLDKLPLDELPKRWGPLAFLFRTRDRPTFGNDHEEVTRKTADLLADCFGRMLIRGVERQTAQRFILQLLVALFSEDIGLLPKYFVTQLLEDCKSKAESYDLLGGLFVAMNTPGKTAGGRFKGVDYFNGGLFSEPARVELEADELNRLRGAAKDDWSKVRPEIFGTLFQHSLDLQDRRATGAHFTHPVDIMKIVGPTIVAPWREQIDSARKKDDVNRLLQRMAHYNVLDPACGSGNFLYTAYRELKRLEAQLTERLAREFGGPQRRLGFVTARQFYGIDVNPFAVELAKVTMMIARKLAIDELHISELPLPLDNLDSNFIACDALIASDGSQTKWPKTDVIIGNPPFVGSRYLAKQHGYEYVRKVHAAFPDVPKMADYCVYWFRKAHDALEPVSASDMLGGRAGLVGTQNIRNNESREGGLDYIVTSGTIVDAVDNQPWSGEANVSVSIVNWMKSKDIRLVPYSRRLWFKVPQVKGRRVGNPPRKGRVSAKEYSLGFRDNEFISSSLSDQLDLRSAAVLRINADPKRVFTGQYPCHDGFRLKPSEAATLLHRDPNLAPVLFPYMTGQDLVSLSGPGSWVIDFGQRNLFEAMEYRAAFEIIEKRVMNDVLSKADRERAATGKESTRWTRMAERWWQFRDWMPGTIAAIESRSRYISCSRVTKYPIFAFVSPSIRPDIALMIFAFDDYSFGVIQSQFHWQWFVAKCSKLTERFRYTGDTVFETFPWPQAPAPKQVDAVANAACELRRVRTENLTKIKGGLRALYRTLELPGANPLKDAHAALDAAVLEAYGFSPKKDLLAQLLELNLEVARRIDAGETVVAPGIPPGYPSPKDLITDDCIQPRRMALFGDG